MHFFSCFAPAPLAEVIVTADSSMREDGTGDEWTLSEINLQSAKLEGKVETSTPTSTVCPDDLLDLEESDEEEPTVHVSLQIELDQAPEAHEEMADEAEPEVVPEVHEGLGAILEDGLGAMLEEGLGAFGDVHERLSSKVSTSSAVRRKRIRNLQRDVVRDYLQKHGFTDLNQPRRCKSFLSFGQEMLYPIHHAAQRGNHILIEHFLREGVNKDQLTSRGRTACQIAEAADHQGSHTMVIALLKGRWNSMPARGLQRAFTDSKIPRSQSEAR
mmetsp:Transcript_70768/g.166044  ORF Transcript_70768/g.166044 Transcript_70768/m.166044 type:complete len:272 (+) Transcript_70768:43-858(+)